MHNKPRKWTKSWETTNKPIKVNRQTVTRLTNKSNKISVNKSLTLYCKLRFPDCIGKLFRQWWRSGRVCLQNSCCWGSWMWKNKFYSPLHQPYFVVHVVPRFLFNWPLIAILQLFWSILVHCFFFLVAGPLVSSQWVSVGLMLAVAFWAACCNSSCIASKNYFILHQFTIFR